MPVTEDSKPNNLGASTNYKEIYSSLKSKLRAILYENELFQDELQKLKHELLDIYRDKESILEILIQKEDIDSSSSDSESQLSDIDLSDTRNLIHPEQALQFSENSTSVPVDQQSSTKTTATKPKPRSRGKASTNSTTTVKNNAVNSKPNAIAAKPNVASTRPNPAIAQPTTTVATKNNDVIVKTDGNSAESTVTTTQLIPATSKPNPKPKVVTQKPNATSAKTNAAAKPTAAIKNGTKTTQPKPARSQKQVTKKQPNKRQAVAAAAVGPSTISQEPPVTMNLLNPNQQIVHMDTSIGTGPIIQLPINTNIIGPPQPQLPPQPNQTDANHFQAMQAPNSVQRHDQIPHTYQTSIVTTTTQNNQIIGQQHGYTIMASNDSGAYIHPQQLQQPHQHQTHQHQLQPALQPPARVPSQMQQTQRQQPPPPPPPQQQQPITIYQPMTMNQVSYPMEVASLRQQQNDDQLTSEQLSAEELERHLESRRMEQEALLLPDWESGATNEIFSTYSAIKFMAED